MLKEISEKQAKIIKKMVLDKKTNKAIAEATGLKYWEVRDYIQYRTGRNQRRDVRKKAGKTKERWLQHRKGRSKCGQTPV